MGSHRRMEAKGLQKVVQGHGGNSLMGISTDGFAITPFFKSWAYEQGKNEKRHVFVASFMGKSEEICADNETEALELLAHYWRTRNTKKISIKRITCATSPSRY